MLSKARTQQEQIIGNFKVAEQLLYAGQTEESIDVLKRIIGDNFAAMSEENKLLFDLYALAYLRLGEQQNCIQNHTSESCIIPIAEAGQHKLVDGSTRAIEIYTKILEKFPKDSQSKWLLNIANMTLGKYPSGVPAAFRIPESVFKPVNGPKFKDIAIDLGVSHRNVSGGVCMEDFDNDGDLDIFMTSYLLNS
jgi:tetratricopeptide (TPR) repeat protein